MMSQTEMSKPVVLLYEEIHRGALAILEERAAVHWTESLDEAALLEVVADVEGIIVRANGKVSRRLMEAATRLKVVGRHGVGVENIDLEAARDLGITVVNTPEANTQSVAEHCLGLMLALASQIVRADKAARRGKWHVRYQYIGTELQGKTLGLVGFGRIGQRTAALCHRALEMPVCYYDVLDYPGVEAELGARRLSLDELLSVADVVSIHVPLLPATRGLIGDAELRRMKPMAILINTARGPVVNQAALVRALTEGWIAGAGLDVFDPEPHPPDSPVFALHNVVVTPHMASHTDEALFRMALVARDVLAVIEGKEPRYPVVIG
jgi:D-3-phosphoglycerate dehydrogenase